MGEVPSIGGVPFYIFVASSVMAALWAIARNTYNNNESRNTHSHPVQRATESERVQPLKSPNPIKICSDCNRLLVGNQCPKCGGSEFQDHFS